MARTRGRGAHTDQTRRRLLDAALATLVRDGYAGATARAIAAEAGCNQASIYYHFGGITGLFIAAMLDSNERRYAAYQAAIEAVENLDDLLAVWQRLHDEDVRTGHIAAVTELLGATAVEPALRDAMVEVTATWRELAASAIRRVADNHPFGQLVPVDQAAEVILATTLGLELLGHIDNDSERPTRLFTTARAIASLLPQLDALTPTADPRP